MNLIIYSIIAGIAASIFIYVIEVSAGFLTFFTLFSPAPIYFIGLSFGVYFSLIAAAAAFISVFLLFDFMFALMFGLVFLLPTIIVIYLALLNREVEIVQGAGFKASTQPQNFNTSQSKFEIQWFPISKILYWVTFIVVIGTSLGFFIKFPTIEDLRPVIQQIIDFNITLTKLEMPAEQIAAIQGFLEENLSGLMAFSWFSSVFSSLYIGAIIARSRGTLLPDWPDLHWLRLPLWYGFVFASASFISIMLPDLGFYLSPLLSCFSIGLWLVGLSIIHRIASQLSMKVPFLVFVYVMMFILMPVNIIIIFLGMADPVLKLREKQNKE